MTTIGNPERLSAQDASFLTLEDDGRAMNVAGLALLRPPPGHGIEREVVRRVVAARIDRVPRLRQRLAQVPDGAARPRWVDAAGFDLDDHVLAATLPRPGTPAQLAAAALARNATAMDRSRPLWDVTLLDGLDDGRLALLIRCHHAMVDGMSGVELARVLFDRDPAAPVEPARPWVAAASPDEAELLDEAAAERWVDSLAAQWNRFADEHDPVGHLDRFASLLEGLRGFLAAGPKEHAPLGPASDLPPRLAIGEVAGDDVRAIRRTSGVPEHVLAASLAAGALARYVATLPAAGRPSRLRALLPVMIPVRDRRARLGNHAAFLVADLPVGPMPEPERLALVGAAVEQARAAGHAATSARLIEMSDRASPALGSTIARLLAKAEFVDIVVSFMRGPRWPLYFSGARLDAIVPVLPLGKGIAAMVGVANLGGSWAWSVTADPGRVPAPGFVVAQVKRALAGLSDAFAS